MSSPAPGGSRPSIAAVQEQIVAELARLDGVLHKYEYLVRLGRALPGPDDSLRRDAHLVPGCQSRAWLRTTLRGGLLHIEADSEALIVRGIVALLLRVLDERAPAEILAGELFFLDRTGLGSHLSPARANGLAVMVRQVRRHAEAAAQPPHPESDRLYDDVRAGLSAGQRKLPPKYFYDDAGASLFERITQLDEYYLTRTELSILQRHIGEIAEAIGPHARIVELGSGSGLKTRLLLRHLAAPASYVPIDLSLAQLRQFASSLASEFPRLTVVPLHADYTREWQLPRNGDRAARSVAFFPGSTIGNLETDAALELLARLRDRLGRHGGLLIGADLHKDSATLERAYNDAEGVTAEFSLNLLRRINRECGTDFDLAAFRHHAFYDEEHHRIEMRLVVRRRSTVTVPARAGSGPALTIAFDPGDHITTEYSHKYTPEGFRRLAAYAGWDVERLWTDENRWFSVWLLRAAS